MSVRVCYLAQLRKAAGRDDDVVPWRSGLTLASLLTELVKQRDPELQRFLFRDDGRLQPTLIITINDQPVLRGQADAAALNDGDTVTLIPPVAGG